MLNFISLDGVISKRILSEMTNWCEFHLGDINRKNNILKNEKS